MTAILEPVAVPALDEASPLACLLAMAGNALSADEQRDEAETAAAHVVLDASSWSGHTALADQQIEASAVIYLEGGLWLHHTLDITERDGARDVLTLVAPCTCGRGYITYQLQDEGDLLGVLSTLRPTDGRTPHEHDDDCASVPAARTPVTK
ncbi:hypothetical protein AB0L42_37940 [Streptomyces sp. NPDC052287]|uniref:hypothetical protein n=1 Tax=Streptomyces sp. NPDC052287 TaxID=3154950 RepID=UPI003432D1A9